MVRSLLFSCGLGFCAALLCPEAHAVVRRNDVPDNFYRSLGNKPIFNSVGKVQISYGGRFRNLGTATLLSDGRLVSAAHVFEDSVLDGATRMRVRFGKRSVPIDLNRPGAINIHPGYRPFTLRNDISVIFLDRPIRIRPARLYSGPNVRLGTPITFVGYGNTGTGLTGQRIVSANKRAGQNALDRFFSGKRRFEVDFDSPYDPSLSSMGSSVPLGLEALLGSGDSGGSVWVRRGRKWELMGINSYGVKRRGRTGRDSEYGDVSGFVYVPRYERWMNSLTDPFSSSTFRGLSAIQPVPEPSTWALLAAGGAVAATSSLLRRRKG